MDRHRRRPENTLLWDYGHGHQEPEMPSEPWEHHGDGRTTIHRQFSARLPRLEPHFDEHSPGGLRNPSSRHVSGEVFRHDPYLDDSSPHWLVRHPGCPSSRTHELLARRQGSDHFDPSSASEDSHYRGSEPWRKDGVRDAFYHERFLSQEELLVPRPDDNSSVRARGFLSQRCGISAGLDQESSIRDQNCLRDTYAVEGTRTFDQIGSYDERRQDCARDWCDSTQRHGPVQGLVRSQGVAEESVGVHGSARGWDDSGRSQGLLPELVRSHDAERDFVRNRDSARDIDDSFQRLDRARDWEDSIQSFDPARDSFPSHDSELDSVRNPDLTKGLVRRYNMIRDSLQNHTSAGGLENPVRSYDYEPSVTSNASTSYEPDPMSNNGDLVESLDPSLSHLARVFNSAELKALQKFINGNKQPPSEETAQAASMDQEAVAEDLSSRKREDLYRKYRFFSSPDVDMPAAWHHARGEHVERSAVLENEIGQKRGRELEPLPLDLQPSAAKQARPFSLLELRIDKRSLVNPPDLEGLFDDDPKPAPAPRVDVNSLPNDQKLRRLIDHLHHRPRKGESDGAFLHLAVAAIHLNPGLRWGREEVEAGLQLLSMTLSLGRVFLARAVGFGRTAMRRKCYTMALQKLLNHDPEEVLRMRDVGLQGVRRLLEEAKEWVKSPREFGWVSFVGVLKTFDPNKLDVIQRIDRALSASQCGLSRDFSVSLENVGGKVFTGSLYIGGILQGQGTGFNVKESKISTYEKAFARFTELELPDVLKGATPLNNDKKIGVKEEDDDDDTERTKPPQPFSAVTTTAAADRILDIKPINTPERIGKLERFIQRVKESAVFGGASSKLGMAGHLLGIPVFLIHRLQAPGSRQFTCQVFLADLPAGTASGEAKVAEAQAFTQALQRVMEASSAESLLLSVAQDETCHRLKREDLEAPDVVAVCVKGEKKKVESNAAELSKALGRFVDAWEGEEEGEEGEEGEWRRRMVLLETEPLSVANLKARATLVLHSSATASGLVLKYLLHTEASVCVCWIKVQGEYLGMGKAYSWTEAKRLASMDVLFKLYETQPVLRLYSKEPCTRWVTRQQLMERLGGASFSEADRLWLQDFHRKHTEAKGEECTEEDRENVWTFARLSLLASKMVGEFIERGDCLDDLVFAPDLNKEARTGVAVCCAGASRVHTKTDRTGSERYLAVTLRVGLSEIMSQLKERGITQTVCCELVQDRTDLPHYADVAAEIKASQTLHTPRNHAGKPPHPSSGATDKNDSKDTHASGSGNATEGHTAVDDGRCSVGNPEGSAGQSLPSAPFQLPPLPLPLSVARQGDKGGDQQEASAADEVRSDSDGGRRGSGTASWGGGGGGRGGGEGSLVVRLSTQHVGPLCVCVCVCAQFGKYVGMCVCVYEGVGCLCVCVCVCVHVSVCMCVFIIY
ncbi:uncharacterized protein LOC143289911 [Babylonia areolata]|uniref:uncharacterized protein LOC143289911 n=1 Tax=Babylonia areolata TaxID=304850 RepID=UPI003FCFA7CC